MGLETLPREQWRPVVELRWSAAGKLQQKWWREVGDYSEHWKRMLWTPEYEWRDVPTEQPALETSVKHSCHCPAGPGGDCHLTVVECKQRSASFAVACPKCIPL